MVETVPGLLGRPDSLDAGPDDFVIEQGLELGSELAGPPWLTRESLQVRLSHGSVLPAKERPEDFQVNSADQAEFFEVFGVRERQV
jgi:hypothetical protein